MEDPNLLDSQEAEPLTPAANRDEIKPQVQSLKELIDLVTGRNLKDAYGEEDSGIAENLPFPFMAIVGQKEMKLALLLALINPNVGGVLLIGPRGTGKTTAVRSLLDLLPEIKRSTCFYGCIEEDIETGGIDAVCPDCAQKFARGEPLTHIERVRLVELPLNAMIEDVVGGLDERALVHERLRLKRGLLSQADQNLLFIDEVNLLADDIVNATLDAAAQGSYTVSRGPTSATYRSRFTLIGSMNPEEGNLRPQIMDRFGLRVIVHGLTDAKERLEVYHRVRSYQTNPRLLLSQFADETQIALHEIQAARRLLPEVELPDELAEASIDLIRKYQIDSLRAEITLLEAARAYAAADSRKRVELEDIRTVAPMALRLRRSSFMVRYFEERSQEDAELDRVIGTFGSPETQSKTE